MLPGGEQHTLRWESGNDDEDPLNLYRYVKAGRDVEQLKVFDTGEAFDRWKDANDPEGVAFDYPVIGKEAAAQGGPKAALLLLVPMKLSLFGVQVLNQLCDALPRNRVHRWIDNSPVMLDLRVEFIALVTHARSQWTPSRASKVYDCGPAESFKIRN